MPSIDKVDFESFVRKHGDWDLHWLKRHCLWERIEVDFLCEGAGVLELNFKLLPSILVNQPKINESWSELDNVGGDFDPEGELHRQLF